ncbi:356_t:CDS:2 [Ambispora leptoticha]|uniref:356_t:CDS:1 n=1 Tax=Ambispora leptoticha TaxID=144679 RepID=A0A9N9E1V8_9GLOM|nr:356_t:CDS:2 [Ambispora leptoticha]
MSIANDTNQIASIKQFDDSIWQLSDYNDYSLSDEYSTDYESELNLDNPDIMETESLANDSYFTDYELFQEALTNVDPKDFEDASFDNAFHNLEYIQTIE